jgi:hypothetical protein
MFIGYLKAEFGSFCFISDGGLRAVLPQPLVQKSFYNLQNLFFLTKFPCHPNGGKNQANSDNWRQMYHRPYEKSSIITLPEILGKLSSVPSMKVSAPHMFMLIQGRRQPPSQGLSTCTRMGHRVLDNCGGVGWQNVLNDKF